MTVTLSLHMMSLNYVAACAPAMLQSWLLPAAATAGSAVSDCISATYLQMLPSNHTLAVMTCQGRQAGQQKTSKTGCGLAGTYSQSELHPTP
jgi:hypothetical protein